MNKSVTHQPFDFCGAEVNPHLLEINFPNGVSESIGRKELGIFAYLVEHPNTVISDADLILSLWGIRAEVCSYLLGQHVNRIRTLYKRHGLTLNAFRTVNKLEHVHSVDYIYDGIVNQHGDAPRVVKTPR